MKYYAKYLGMMKMRVQKDSLFTTLSQRTILRSISSFSKKTSLISSYKKIK